MFLNAFKINLSPLPFTGSLFCKCTLFTWKLHHSASLTWCGKFMRSKYLFPKCLYRSSLNSIHGSDQNYSNNQCLTPLPNTLLTEHYEHIEYLLYAHTLGVTGSTYLGHIYQYNMMTFLAKLNPFFQVASLLQTLWLW